VIVSPTDTLSSSLSLLLLLSTVSDDVWEVMVAQLLLQLQ